MAKPGDMDNLAQTALAKHGRIDAIFNNAGVMPTANLSEIHRDEWRTMLDINIMGVLNSIAAVLPTMKQQKSGHIIATDSVERIRANVEVQQAYGNCPKYIQRRELEPRGETQPAGEPRVRPGESGEVDPALVGHLAPLSVVELHVDLAVLGAVVGDDQYAVFVVQDSGELEMRMVEVGLQDYVNAEILSGLELGETVSVGETTSSSSSSQSSTDTGSPAMPDGGMMMGPMMGG